jgi:alpha-1,3-rhamnosyl/mannosyltransferase
LQPALKASGLNIPLVCAGWSGWEQSESFSRVMHLGHVPDEDLAGLYCGAVAFVFPSLYEGFGLPVLEAMACGCPVVTSDRASMPEVGGESVLYCRDPQNPAAWAELLCRVAGDADLRKRLQHMGPARAEAFSWEQTARTTWKVLGGR